MSNSWPRTCHGGSSPLMVAVPLLPTARVEKLKPRKNQPTAGWGTHPASRSGHDPFLINPLMGPLFYVWVHLPALEQQKSCGGIFYLFFFLKFCLKLRMGSLA